MKISFNPSNSNKNILDLIKNNKDIIFDLKGHSIFARGVEFKGTDTNTWRDIKINNVSIGSHTLDLRNGSNTTLTNTNGVVTINSTWRPVVDNLTSDSTTSSLSAKQGKVLKALIDGKSNSDHTHDDRYLKLSGGTMTSNALITFADSGSWYTDKGPQGARGGLYWSGQSDYAKLYAEETTIDNLDLVIQFGDDYSNGLSIRNKANTQTSYISSSGVITTGTFKGNLDWSYITNKPATATRWPSWAEVTGKPSAFNPAAHTHTVFKNNLMIKGTNGISDSASIHLGIGDSDTGFKWIFDGVCQIYANNVAVGQWTSGGMDWFKNPTVNGNKVWNAGNDGSGSGLDADTVDGYHATDGRTFTGDIHWGSWNNTWSDGTHTHPWYGFDHRYSNTGAYSTTITDYFGMTIKTYNTLLLDCGTLLLNSRNNVGIGTTSPTQKLDVVGNIRVTGQIIRGGYGQMWVNGRNGALLRETSVAGYHTLWSLKTTDGSWDFGEYNAGSEWNNIPVLSYITDSNYNSGSNTTTYQIKFPLASGTIALTSNIPNPTNYYWANVKISASSSTTTSPTFSNVYLGNSLYLNNRGSNSIYNGPNDSANGVGGPLNNLVFSSWQGVSFTTSCAGLTYTNKNAVSINCRTGQLYAREVQANGFMHTGHNNNDAVLLAGGGYKTLKDFIFLNKSYNYTDNEHYNLAFHKLSGICNNLVWVDGHVKGSIAKFFVIDPAVFPYRYDDDPNLNTIYLMTGNNYITINAIGIVTINNATDHKQRVGFFYTGRA